MELEWDESKAVSDNLRPEYELSNLRVRRTGPKRSPRLTVAPDDVAAAIPPQTPRAGV